MSILIDTPFKVFFDANGDPLDEGYVYIGVAGLNPITNPLVVYWDADLSIPATNIRTVNGFPSYRGAPGNIYTSTNYSILVKNRQGAVVYSNLNNANYLTDAKKIFGDYDVETVVIAGTTDKKLIFVNRQTGKSFTLTETQSPAGTTTEAVHRLGALASTIDWRFDFALHNKDAGVMKGLHLLQCYNDDATAAMYWVFRHRPAGETDYGTLEDYYMMKLDETDGLQVNVAKSEGLTPTWVKILTEETALHGETTFLASGSFTVPAGITKIYATGVGGGGNGGTGGTGYNVVTRAAGGGGGGGGSGAWCIRVPITVVPGTVHAVQIGIATPTLFGTLLSLAAGGNGGNGGNASSGTPGAAGAAGAAGTDVFPLYSGLAGEAGEAGVTAVSPETVTSGGNGGASQKGGLYTYDGPYSGGNGANRTDLDTHSTSGVAATRYGCGGGGGGGGGTYGSNLKGNSAGGAGMPGFLLLEW